MKSTAHVILVILAFIAFVYIVARGKPDNFFSMFDQKPAFDDAETQKRINGEI